MFFLGCLSFICITFIPGFIIYKPLKIRINLLIDIIFCFGLSLIANYIIISTLRFLGLYTSFVIYIFYSSLFIYFIISLFYKKYENKYYLKLVSFYLILLSLYILCSILLNTDFFLSKIGYRYIPIFTKWDPICFYNKAAIEWFNGEYPNFTQYYPQLLSAVFSLSYIFLKTSNIEYFSKAICPLFYIFILILVYFFPIKNLKRNTLLNLFSSLLTGILLFLLLKTYVFAGYSDLPIVFFNLLMLYCLGLLFHEQNLKIFKKKFILACLFAIGSSLTKHYGLLNIWIFIIIFIFILRNHPLKNSFKKKEFIKYFLLTLFLVIPTWIKLIHTTITVYMKKYTLGSNMFVANKTSSIVVVIINAFKTLDKDLPLFIFFILILIYIISAYKNKLLKYFFIFNFIPYFLVWLFLGSWDSRNLSINIPIISLSVLYFLSPLIKKRFPIKNKQLFNQITLKKYLIISFFILLLFSITLNKSLLIEKHNHFAAKRCYPKMNKAIYEYVRNNPQIKIITDYEVMNYMPVLKNIFMPLSYTCGPESLNLYQIKKENPPASHLLTHLMYLNKEDLDKFITKKKGTFVSEDFEKKFNMIFIKFNSLASE